VTDNILVTVSAPAVIAAALSTQRPVFAEGDALDSRTYWALRGRRLAGFVERAQSCYDDFMLVGSDGLPFGVWTPSGTANRALFVHDDNGQGWQYAVTSAGIGAGYIRPVGNAALNQWLPFHVHLRMRLTANVAATTSICGRLMRQDLPHDTIEFGYIGAVSASQWSLRIVGAGSGQVVSGVAADNAAHVHELYATDPDGAGWSTNLTYAVDGVAVATLPNPDTWNGGALYDGLYISETVAANRAVVVSRYGATFQEM
jgi:hypothetical protein